MQLSYRIPHTLNLSLSTHDLQVTRQLASSLVRQHYSYVYMYELGFHRFRQLPTNVYNMWRRVISSIVKAAFVCPWLSYSITLWINKVHTLSLIMYTSKRPNKTAYTTSLPNSLHRPFLWIFSTFTCF